MEGILADTKWKRWSSGAAMEPEKGVFKAAHACLLKHVSALPGACINGRKVVKLSVCLLCMLLSPVQLSSFITFLSDCILYWISACVVFSSVVISC